VTKGHGGMFRQGVEAMFQENLLLFFFFTLVTWPLSLKLSDTRVYEPQIRARLGNTGRLSQVTKGHGGMFRQGVEAMFQEDHPKQNTVNPAS